MADVQKIESFEDVLFIVGDNGPFQKKFSLKFNIINTFLVTMPYFNVVLALLVPEHWCNVPGRNQTNLSVEDWKDLTIPKDYDSSGLGTYSSCKMYNRTTGGEYSSSTIDSQIIDCRNGWDYNKEWFQRSIPTDYDWVCEKSLRVANAFTLMRIGECGGMFLTGIFTDLIGRKPMYIIGTLVLTFSRLLTAFTPSYYYLFLIACTLSCSTNMSVIQTVQILAIEITHPDARSLPAIQQWIAWTVALSVLPLVMWITGEWFLFLLITTLPALVFLIIFSRSAIESPRWLLNVGKVDKCIVQLNKIAKENKTSLPNDIYTSLCSLPRNAETPMGYFSLFGNWRCTKNTICCTFCWSVYQIVYYMLLLNVGNLNGNPLLNFFLQSVVELPGYLVSKVAAERFGRRWTNVVGFIGTGIGCIVLIFGVAHPDRQWLVTPVAVFLKFTISVCYYAFTLQATEMYPTCLRQTGLSFSGIVSNCFAIVAPYVSYLGSSYDARLPHFTLALFSFAAAIAGFALPETLHQKLPDTIAESQVFGGDQDLWGIPKRFDKRKDYFTYD